MSQKITCAKYIICTKVPKLLCHLKVKGGGTRVKNKIFDFDIMFKSWLSTFQNGITCPSTPNASELTTTHFRRRFLWSDMAAFGYHYGHISSFFPYFIYWPDIALENRFLSLLCLFRGVFRGSALRDSMTQNSVDLYLASPGKYMVYFLSNLFYQHLGEPRSLKCSSVGLPVLTLLRSGLSWVVALSEMYLWTSYGLF